jgi:hypothetical protein
MLDRELLELAAKAAGIEVFWGYPGSDQYDHRKLYLKQDAFAYTAREWNPLSNDGDALRLAVDLRIKFERHLQPYVAAWAPETISRFEEPEDPDKYAATRRAIVRAAAEIGRNND